MSIKICMTEFVFIVFTSGGSLKLTKILTKGEMSEVCFSFE